MDLRPLAPESYSVDQFSTTSGGCFDFLSKVVQFQYKKQQIVQNRSLTIIDHQKLVIANFFVILFHEM